jgi:hypothetical protein
VEKVDIAFYRTRLSDTDPEWLDIDLRFSCLAPCSARKSDVVSSGESRRRNRRKARFAFSHSERVSTEPAEISDGTILYSYRNEIIGSTREARRAGT